MMSSELNNISRKRKQEISSSLPTTTGTCWTDFIYSSPSSPSNENPHFNFDSFLGQHVPTTNSGSNSRRHSVAVGEMDYHSFDLLKQDSTWDELQFLLNTTTDVNMDRPIHKRTMSLREDNPSYATLLSPTLSSSSNNSNLFSQSFLDALVAENNNDAATMISDMSSLMESTGSHSQVTTEDLLKLATTPTSSIANPLDSTITPAVITKEINTMADWLLEQQQQQQPQGKKQRRSTSSLSPLSPTQTLGSSMSSNSPSPPITPMQSSSLGFEPIQEDYTSLLLSKNGLLSTARMMQGVSSSLQLLIQEYLLQKKTQPSLPGERTVMVLTSRVAQKSYGTEKRFLCPPPTTILKGANWWTNTCSSSDTQSSSTLFQSPSTVLAPPKLTIHISGETINQNGVLEWQTPNGTTIDPSTAAPSSTSFVSGRCVSKQLYINDADEKRKRVEVLAKIQLSNGLQLGTFPSKGIKVISKPSKKRQSVKNMELCIHHGTTISLFNRIRSQTVSTKYLGVSTTGPDKNSNSGTCFVARTGSWDPFVVWIVDTTHTPDTMPRTQPQHHPNNPDFPPPPAIALQSSSTLAVHYNQPVVLQCVTTGLVSPVMIIRKVDKGSMVLGGTRSEDNLPVGGECGDETLGDPVSQLHKVAFQIVQDPSFSQHQKTKNHTDTSSSLYKIPQSCHPVTYLACLNDVVGMHKTNYTRHLVPACTKETPVNSNTIWNELMMQDDKKGRRRSSTDRVAERRGSNSDGVEGACWTEDVSDAAVWTIVGTDCASYTYWTPSEQTSPITPFPVINTMKKTDMFHISLSGENFSRDLSVWFGDVKSPQTDYKSRDSILCKIPDIQELLNSPTVVDKKVPLLFVRGDGVVYRTNQFYAL